VDWEDWKPTYMKIVQQLSLDPDQDRLATSVLTTILSNSEPNSLLESLRESIEEKNVLVCGAGPSLEKHLNQIMRNDIDSYTIVVADGACSALIENQMTCDVVITDLDGDLNDIKRCQKKGAILVIHAHGDNIDAIKKQVPTMLPVLGSTQVEPTDHVFLWGGFTDGDRATHLVAEYKPKHVVLAGMDFGVRVGKWSKPGHKDHYQADSRKAVKLAIAQDLLCVPLEKAGIEYSLLSQRN
jgi:uncharacterized Rossmann fold enzyme